ncbi:MAG: YebC/PmpR family DNA-binding transcriptional regulator [Mariprofundales bacterium]
MSGHSKWSTIKHKKAATDAKRGKLFTRYIRELTIAARGGADPDGNPRLRSAIAAAKGVNMPKDNIDRAIAKGSGTAGGAELEEIRYEGYGQGGVAILVDCVTDNRNRTVSDVRSAFNKGGGNMGESGCVAWMFHQKGEIMFDRNVVSEDAIMEPALEAGAEDITDKEDEGCVEIITDPTEFVSVKESLEGAGFIPQLAELSWIPENVIAIEGEPAEKLLKLIDRLEEVDDVQDVYANYDISEAEMERIHG